MSISERLAYKVVGLAHSTCADYPMAQTPAYPNAEMGDGCFCMPPLAHVLWVPRCVWAALRDDECREVNKKFHRLGREERLRVRSAQCASGPGSSWIAPIEADARNVVWVGDFSPTWTAGGKAVEIASIIDGHPGAR